MAETAAADDAGDLTHADPLRAALNDCVRRVLEPLVELLLARGMKFGEAQELLKSAFVEVAARLTAGDDGARSLSVVSVASGVHRREVKRLLVQHTAPARRARSYASEVFARWTTDRAFLDDAGRPRPLPRTAPDEAPSFDRLAAAVSSDVHARSILDEMLMLDLVDEAEGVVRLKRGSFVPENMGTEMLRFLGINVGDHLNAATRNLLSPEPAFLEQALFADELTEDGARQAARQASQAWLAAYANLTPQWHALADADARAPENRWRVRFGVYTYVAPMDGPDAASSPAKRLAAPYRNARGPISAIKTAAAKAVTAPERNSTPARRGRGSKVTP